MCIVGFLHKHENEVMEFLSSIVELTRGWEESLAREANSRDLKTIMIGMNHACISVEFSVFFIAKMHDSQNFSLISH